MARPVKTVVATLKNDKSKRIEMGALWASKIEGAENFSFHKSMTPEMAAELVRRKEEFWMTAWPVKDKEEIPF